MFLAKVDEIWLKSPPIRRKLIEKLLQNLRERGLKAVFYDTRILVEGEKAEEVLAKTFGIRAFAKAIEMERKPEVWLKKLEELMEKGKAYRILVHRGDKGWPKTSVEIAAELAKALEGKGYTLSLKNYEETLKIEIRRDKAFLLLEEQGGPGGLPYGSQGKALALFSGGIDSPVAAWMIAKRGVAVDYLTFAHCNCIDERVKAVADFLREEWGMKGDHYIFNGREVVEWIKGNIPRKYRMVAFKAILYRIASTLAGKTKAQALITGESLNQVSTQTLGTLPAITTFSSHLVLRPLIGMDKEETKEIARKIGTLALSEKVEEKCQLAKKVVTKVREEKLRELLKGAPFNREYILRHVVRA